MQNARNRMQIFERMRTRNHRAKVLNVSVGPWRGSVAIQNGYEELDIMEVYEYEMTKYDPHTREGGLFADYVNLLTSSMVQSPSWEANCFASSQEIPRNLWNPKVH